MMRLLTVRALEILNRHVPIDETKREIYLYGIDLFLYTLISTAGLILIAALMGRAAQGLIIIALYYLNQTLGGGFHASTHLRCFLMMAAGLILSLLALSLDPPRAVIWSLVLLSGGALLLFPLKLHKNKAYLKPKSPRFIKRSRCVTALEALLFVLLQFFWPERLLYAYGLGMLAAAVSRSAAVALSKNEET